MSFTISNFETTRGFNSTTFAPELNITFSIELEQPQDNMTDVTKESKEKAFTAEFFGNLEQFLKDKQRKHSNGTS